MKRNYHYPSMVQIAFKQYRSIKKRYGMNESDPLGKIHMSIDEAIFALMAALASHNPAFSDFNACKYYVRKVILDYFVGKAFKEAVRSGDMSHYNMFVSAINPTPLAFCHVAKSILQKDYSRWAGELTTAGYDAVSVANDVCLKLYLNNCTDSQGNEIKAVMGEVRKAMKHCYIDGLKKIGVYNKGKKDGAKEENLEQEAVANAIGPKRIPANQVYAIDTQQGASFDIPEEIDDDVLADNGVDLDLQKQIGSDRLTFWMVVAEIAEVIRGFQADEFSKVVAHMYGEKEHPITQKQAFETVANALGIPVATVNSHFHRCLKKAEAMGAHKADMLIARLRAKYAETQEEEL